MSRYSNLTMNNKDKILVVEDEKDIADLIHVHLAELAVQGDVCGNGEQALQLALANDYQLVMLDIMLPGLSGLDICRQLRTAKPMQAILMLTSRTSEMDRVLQSLDFSDWPVGITRKMYNWQFSLPRNSTNASIVLISMLKSVTGNAKHASLVIAGKLTVPFIKQIRICFDDERPSHLAKQSELFWKLEFGFFRFVDPN